MAIFEHTRAITGNTDFLSSVIMTIISKEREMP
jgi:hypothetical protein